MRRRRGPAAPRHWQALKDIVLPLIKPGMVAAFFLIFLPALRELTTSVLLYGPTTRTIGVAIYALNEDGETVYAATLAVGGAGHHRASARLSSSGSRVRDRRGQ